MKNQLRSSWIIGLSTAILSIGSILGAPAEAEEDNFLQEINQLWTERKYDEIRQLAEEHAPPENPTPEAFAVLFGYWLYIDPDKDHAVAALEQLMATIEMADPEGHEAINEFLIEFQDHAQEGLEALTEEQRDALHDLFPDRFPVDVILTLLTPDE
jgi:hypothetical protein